MTIQANPPAGAEVERTDLVTVTIDDIEVKVPKNSLAIRAAEQIGIQIPRFCDHPLLDPVGACRQCLVEVPDAGNGRGMPKPQASCTLTVADGMVIRTQVSSPVADKAQHGNMEFLLINHPLDCPVCDKGGECPLQNQAMTNGQGESRFTEVKRTYPKPINISAEVLLDRERCILCARCTRFSEQIAGDPFIALIERGALQQVGIYEKEPFESYFSGNTIQICPVGALTSAAYRFRSRPFDLVSVPSVAEHDSSGAAIRVDYRRGKVMRRLAGDDPEVNEEWISDKDRFAFNYASTGDRLTHPMIREDGVLRPASWPEALTYTAEKLTAARGNAAVLTGGRLTLEDAYAYSKFARVALGTNDIDFRARPYSAEEADFLAAAVAGTGLGTTFADLENAASVLLAGFEPEEEAASVFLRLRKGVKANGTKVFTLAPFASRGVEKLDGVVVPAAPGTESVVLADLGSAGETGAAARAALGAQSIIIVGERLASVPGGYSAALRLALDTGAQLVWIPRRAGDRGALEAGCLPGLLPGGRLVSDAQARVDLQAAWGVDGLPTGAGKDTGEILAAAGSLGALLVAGVEIDDLPDPAAALAALAAAPFVVSFEVRNSQVTEYADVVFPVVPPAEKDGTFVNWEGRERPFPVVLQVPAAMPDVRALAALAQEMDASLGFTTPAGAKREYDELGRWDGDRAQEPTYQAGPALGAFDSTRLATWRMLIDDSRANDGEPHLTATARKPVARISPTTAHRAGVADGDELVVSTDAGSVRLPVLITPMTDNVVWLPTNSADSHVRRSLHADHGSIVTIAGGTA
ncbi:NADH-quinone oxidoreductase subunit G [Kribbella sandramycini]|uniref:NADH-quinone oxidoreductase n=1 Tax=Kribbella sandramycini TaxID=60450 RepID=A0A7Y4L1C6_9ACTN|nr:NADH-quinone oxidoreductase subunit G [Kribbella sandramycini]MBB6564818.1 NADH-quinone oxidoreductase subunit G [Kribbella sandramycini]NOL42517.1 NADH-quinone oxidoreductase subunit G [Kribbella sandramycini]